VTTGCPFSITKTLISSDNDRKCCRTLPLLSQWTSEYSTQCHYIPFQFLQGMPWTVCGLAHVTK
jgi:hypothetical protein